MTRRVGQTGGRLGEALAFIVRVRISEWRFRWHQRLQERHDARALGHLMAMTVEMQRRADLCARYRGRPGPPVPRSRSGIPLVPHPSHQVTAPPNDAPAAVPSCGGASPCPEGAEGRSSSPRGNPRLI